MATTQDYGFGEFQFPRGWFMISPAVDLEKRPIPLRFFGQDLVLYRGESGAPYLVEAYCPHMGAHLAKNTTSYIVLDGEQVQGESIRCPFHGWRFDGAAGGKCDHIPYSDFIPEQARLKTFPVIERAGIIWMWHDSEGREPEFPLPEFGGHYGTPGWVNWKIDFMGDVDIHPVEILDNMVDIAHFTPIHGSTDVGYFINEFQDHVVWQHFGSGHRTLVSEAGAMLETRTWYTGPGILQSEMMGGEPSLMFIAHTPIEDGKVRVWHGLMVKVNDGGHAVTEEEHARAYAYQESARLAFAQDVEIWQNKRACIRPLAIPGDGPIGKVRGWYWQFYNPRDKAGDFRRRVNGTVVKVDNRPAKDKTAA
jgi:3-ketosteroid 9alpha-monooxygenase subunit A